MNDILVFIIIVIYSLRGCIGFISDTWKIIGKLSKSKEQKQLGGKE